MKHELIDPEHAAPAGGTGPAEARRLSAVLKELAREATGPVAIGTIRHALGDRSLAALLAFFAAINLLPLPPGTTIVLGPPLIIIAIEMIACRKEAWLPRSVLSRSIEAARFRQMITRMMPYLVWLERAVRPRWWPFPSDAAAERVIGTVALVLSIAVTLPIPFGNWLPAFATFLVALALSERDGLLFFAGLVVAVLAFVVIAAVFGTAHALFGLLFA